VEAIAMQILKFRPSSHSDDGTLVATFKSEAEARRANLRVEGSVIGKQVVLQFNNQPEGSIGHYEAQLETLGARDVAYYDRYEELLIQVTLPPMTTEGIVPLVVNAETAMIIRELSKLCPKRNIKFVKGETQTTLEFRYAGEGLMAKMGTALEFFYGQEVPIPSNIKVTVLRAL
jgi:hypothetical protein